MARNVKIGGGVVYLITNMVNGKYYVGQTGCLQKRINQHVCCGRPGRARFPISKAIAKYGKENFLFEQIGIAETQPGLDSLEAVWILALRSHDGKSGYNRRLGGGGSSCCEETRALQSEAGKNRSTPTWGPHNPMPEHMRKNLSDLIRERNSRRVKKEPSPKIYKSRKKDPSDFKKRAGPWVNGCPDDVRKKMVESWAIRRASMPPKVIKEKVAKPRNPLSPEALERLRARSRDPEIRRKISEAKTGVPRPDNADRNKALYSVLHSPDAKLRRSASQKRYYQTVEGRNSQVRAGHLGASARWGKA